MKVIISHDIDHLSVWEHKNDLIIPKFLVRNFIELGYGTINSKILWRRFGDVIKNRWNNLNELIDFDCKNNLKSTYFFAMNNDSTLAYNYKDAEKWIKKVIDNGLDAGVHGITFDDFDTMQEEYNRFKVLSGLDDFGIRMHYLRMNENTLKYMEKIGYIFDTTEHSPNEKQAYNIGKFTEIPFHIMDTQLFDGKRFQTYDIKHAKEVTKRRIEEMYKADGIMNINFHQRYFSDSWLDWKEWYIWFIDYCKENNFEFVNYRRIVDEFNDLRD